MPPRSLGTETTLIQALAADERDSAAYLRLTHRLGFHRCGRTF